MATLEELTVKINADLKGFQGGLVQSQKMAKGASNKMQNAFSSIGSSILGATKKLFTMQGALAAAAGAVGLGYLAKQSLDAADSIAKLASNTGVSAELLQELRFAASQTGVAQNDLDSSLQRFNRRLADAAAGSAEFKKGFEALGVQIRNEDGSLRSTEAVLLDVADGVQDLGSESKQASALFKVFGDSGFRLVNLFKGGSTELMKFQTEAREMGLVLSDNMLLAAEDTNDKLDLMAKVLSTQVTKAVINLAPQIQALTGYVIDFTTALVNMITTTPSERMADLKKEIGATQIAIQSIQQDIDQAGDTLFGAPDYLIDAKKKKLTEYQAKLQGLQEELQNLAKQEENRRTVDPGGDGDGADPDELKRLKALEEKKRAERQAEISGLIEKNELLRELGREQDEALIAQNQERIERLKAQEDQYSNFILQMKVKEQQEKKALRLKEEKDEQELRQKNLQAAQALSGNLMNLARGQSKELFALAKASSIATAIINTYEGATKALAQGGIFGTIQAAAVITSGLAQVAQIKAQKFNRGTDSVPGIGNRDTVPAILTPGERVVPKETNKDLTNFMKQFARMGGGSQGGELTVRFEFDRSDSQFLDWLEAKLIERRNLNLSVGGLA